MRSDFMHSHAVVIGIDRYQHVRPLSTAVADARQLCAFLQEAHGYDDIVLLEDATRETLALELGERLPARVDERDRLLLYFAGHGIAQDGDDGPEGFLIPADAKPDDRGTFVSMADLYMWLEALPCRHLLVILDCCFAGAFTWYGRRHLAAAPQRLYQEHYDRFVREPAWQILTSAAHDQEALDVVAGAAIGVRGEITSNGERHSPFAQALFAGLQGEADLTLQGQRDGVVTATELYLYLRQALEADTARLALHRQTPELWPFSRKKHGKGEFIFLVPGQGKPKLPRAPKLTQANNPYRGLQAYDEADADLFFGRRELIRTLATAVDRQPLTAVLGASGTGKSSLVKAGLVPYLVKSKESHPDYQILPAMRPSSRPLQALTDLIAAHQPGWPQALRRSGRVQTIKQVVSSWLAEHPEKRLLLIVDQFEELVTLRPHEAERMRFLSLLADLLDHHPERLRVVVTLRTDFEQQFDHTPLYSPMKAGSFVVPAMNRAELREVIVGPAAARVLFFDPPELVDHLVDEVLGTPGALPLLSFTLSELYLKYLKRQRYAQLQGEILDRSLQESDYDDLGGVRGSLRNRAYEEYMALPDDTHRQTMRRVLLRMVAIEGGELARRRVPFAELDYTSAEENGCVDKVLERLVAARLVVGDRGDLDSNNSPDAYVEPAHDALIREWGQLLVWKQETDDELPLALQRRLTQAAFEWHEADVKGKGGLLWNNNPRLLQVKPFVKEAQTTTTVNRLNRVETAFIQESLRVKRRNRTRLITSVIIVFLALLGLSLYSGYQAEQATRSEATAIAESNQRATAEAIAVTRQAEAERESQISRSERLAASANLVMANQDDRSGSLALLLAHAAVDATRTLSDGLVLDNAYAALVDAVAYASPWRMTIPRTMHTAPVRDVAYSPDGITFATASGIEIGTRATVDGLADNTARLWDVATGRQIRLLAGHRGIVRSVAYRPDGSTVVTTSDDATACMWDVATGTQLDCLRGHGDAVWSAEYDPRAYCHGQRRWHSPSLERQKRPRDSDAGGSVRDCVHGCV